MGGPLKRASGDWHRSFLSTDLFGQLLCSDQIKGEFDFVLDHFVAEIGKELAGVETDIPQGTVDR
jgi:hypothetical protein